jgi:hypothetical protein
MQQAQRAGRMLNRCARQVLPQMDFETEGQRALLQQVAIAQAYQRPLTRPAGRRQTKVGADAGRFTRGQRNRCARPQSRSST